MNRRLLLVLYWIMSGALIGVAFIALDVWFVFLPCALVGLSLAIFGQLRWGVGYLWAAVIGLGAAPALFIINDIIRSLPFCPQQGETVELTLPPNAPSASCGVVPASYYV